MEQSQPRVVAAFAVAGGLLVAVGIAFGFWPVGHDCGSGFSPADLSWRQGTDDMFGCNEALAGRSVGAWVLILVGIALLIGALVARRRVPGWM